MSNFVINSQYEPASSSDASFSSGEFTSYSSSFSSRSESLPPVLRWENCTTLDRKIGFIIGQAIPVIIKGTWKGVVFTVKLAHLDQAAIGCNRLSRAIFRGLSSCTIYIPNTNTCPQVSEFCARFFAALGSCASSTYGSINPCIEGTAAALNGCKVSFTVTSSIVWNRCNSLCSPIALEIFRGIALIANRIGYGSIYLYERIIPHCGRAVSSVGGCLQSCSPVVDDACNAISNCLNNSASAICSIPLVVQASACCSENTQIIADIVFQNIIVPMDTYVMSPAYSWVIAPAGRFIGNFSYALLSGCCGNNSQALDDSDELIDKLLLPNQPQIVKFRKYDDYLRLYGLINAIRQADWVVTEEDGRYKRTASNLQSEKPIYAGSAFTIIQNLDREATCTFIRHLKTE